jgi:gliding motility-associated-like protein
VQAIQVFGTDTCFSARIPVTVTLTIQPVETREADTTVCEGATMALPWGETVTVTTDASFTHEWAYAESGCDSAQLTIHAFVQNASLHIDMDSVFNLHLGDSVELKPQVSFLPDSVIWLPGVGLSCDTCLQTWAKPNQSTAYDLHIWSQEGCLVSAYVKVELSREIRIYIPNVFTPNGDVINDLFTVFAKREVAHVNKLTIFSRWGEVIWEHSNFLPDGSVGWDGTFRGEPMSPGVFVWMCEIELIDGSRETLSGDVTLIR